jgi:hypothetical protein
VENTDGKVFRALTERELDELKEKLDRIELQFGKLPCSAHGERLARVEVRAAMIAIVIGALVAAGVRILGG